MHTVVFLRKLEKSLKPLVRAVCLYEAVALSLPKNPYTPPLSVIMHKHKWFMGSFLIILGAHAWWLEIEEKVNDS